jgi:steroid 5-alpha reductase family enzyme
VLIAEQDLGLTSQPILTDGVASMDDILLVNAAVVAGLMLAVWLVSLPLRDVSIVDIVWGLGFVLVAWFSYSAQDTTGKLLLPSLTTIWGIRLSGYLAWRKAGSAEDYRYREMRDRYPQTFPLRSLLTVFMLQGVLMWVIALPLQLTGSSGPRVDLTTVGGVLLWSVGFLFESIGDAQLARFKTDQSNDGRVMDRGLWRYTRHPNYFGDFLVWWGFYLLALGSGAPWWTVVGPIVMSVLLMRVSGVTLLERSLKNRKQGYEDYVARTNAFFPWRPRPARETDAMI